MRKPPATSRSESRSRETPPTSLQFSCRCSQTPAARHRGRNLRGSALAQRKEILRAFNRLAQAAEKFLKILIALDEVDLRGIPHQQIRRGVAKEKVSVGVGDGLQV